MTLRVFRGEMIQMSGLSIAARRFSAWALLCVGASSAAAQSAASPPPGEDLEIYVMTMGPGDLVWSRFGHNAIGIRDRTAGTDIVYNWGTFDFQQSNFLLRFVQGRMLYWVADGDALLTQMAYDRDNRAVQIQELNLTPPQRAAVRDFIAWNMREENRFYRYDYFRDNCSTRVRDVLDLALGGALKRQFVPAKSGFSFRDEARRLMEPDPWTYTGIDIGLGAPSDREMTRWEAMFIPMRLRDLLREVKVDGPDGAPIPLVASERTVVTTTRPAEPDTPPNHLLRYLLLGLVVALAIAALAGRGTAGARIARVVAITWCAFAGLIGLLILGLWTATDHVWAYSNANLLLFHPLWFAVIPFVRRSPARLGSAARALIGLCAVCAAIALVLAVLGRPQATAQMAALALPPIAATLWLVWRGAAQPSLRTA
jgi:hypothetical protein